MRRAAIWLALLGLFVALPASASVIAGLELRGFSARPIDRSVTLRVNDLSDQTIDAFTVLDVGSSGAVTLSSGALNRIFAAPYLGSGGLVSGGSISIVGRLVETHAAFGRRVFVWVGGAPDTTAPIPEPSSALLFAVGTGLVVAWLRRPRA